RPSSLMSDGTRCAFGGSVPRARRRQYVDVDELLAAASTLATAPAVDPIGVRRVEDRCRELAGALLAHLPGCPDRPQLLEHRLGIAELARGLVAVRVRHPEGIGEDRHRMPYREAVARHARPPLLTGVMHRRHGVGAARREEVRDALAQTRHLLATGARPRHDVDGVLVTDERGDLGVDESDD